MVGYKQLIFRVDLNSQSICFPYEIIDIQKQSD